MNLNIKSKLIIFILFPIAILFILLFIVLSGSINTYKNNTTQKLSEKTAEKYTSLINEKVLSDIELLNTLRNYFENADVIYTENELLKQKVLKDIVVNKQNLFGVWFVFEDEKNQRKINRYVRQENEIKHKSGKIANDNFYNEIYQNMKNEPNETGLFSHKTNVNNEERKLSFSIAVPVFRNNEIVGITGFDFNIRKLFKDIDLFSDNNEVNLILAFNNDFIEIKPTTFLENKNELSKSITNALNKVNKSFVYEDKNDNVEYFVSINPLNFKAKSVNLSLVVLTSNNELKSISAQFSMRFFVFTVLGLLLLFLIVTVLVNRFLNKLKITSTVLNAMATGKVSEIEDLDYSRGDEISEMNYSINQINQNLDKTASFIEEIAKGNFSIDYQSLTKEDRIGNSLIDMKLSLENAKDLEIKRKGIDEKLNWATLGTARFSEIIREHSDNLEELAYAIISDLVNYIDANQGGLFIINEDAENNKYIELLASYAYSRRKMLTKKIPWGVGLVGRCIQEKETIFMSKIPQKYLSITSGLGEENPANLLIVPLIFHEEVFGVVELASFNEIEQYKIDLVEQISESIASAISMVKINVRTAELLRETKIKSEQAASQEEEIRQNIEEMQASTDELNNQLEDIKGTFNAINSVANIAQFDLQGRITNISDSFLKLLKKDKNEIIGKVQGSFSTEAQNKESFKNFWKELRKGKTLDFEQVIKIEDDLVRIYSVYMPVKNEGGEVYKVVSFAQKQ